MAPKTAASRRSPRKPAPSAKKIEAEAAEKAKSPSPSKPAKKATSAKPAAGKKAASAAKPSAPSRSTRSTLAPEPAKPTTRQTSPVKKPAPAKAAASKSAAKTKPSNLPATSSKHALSTIEEASLSPLKKRGRPARESPAKDALVPPATDDEAARPKKRGRPARDVPVDEASASKIEETAPPARVGRGKPKKAAPANEDEEVPRSRETSAKPTKKASTPKPSSKAPSRRPSKSPARSPARSRGSLSAANKPSAIAVADKIDEYPTVDESMPPIETLEEAFEVIRERTDTGKQPNGFKRLLAQWLKFTDEDQFLDLNILSNKRSENAMWKRIEKKRNTMNEVAEPENALGGGSGDAGKGDKSRARPKKAPVKKADAKPELSRSLSKSPSRGRPSKVAIEKPKSTAGPGRAASKSPSRGRRKKDASSDMIVEASVSRTSSKSSSRKSSKSGPVGKRTSKIGRSRGASRSPGRDQPPSVDDIVPSIEGGGSRPPSRKASVTTSKTSSGSQSSTKARAGSVQGSRADRAGSSAAKSPSRSPSRGRSASPSKEVNKKSKVDMCHPLDHGFEKLLPSSKRDSRREPEKPKSRSPSRSPSRQAKEAESQGKTNPTRARSKSPATSRKPSDTAAAETKPIGKKPYKPSGIGKKKGTSEPDFDPFELRPMGRQKHDELFRHGDGRRRSRSASKSPTRASAQGKKLSQSERNKRAQSATKAGSPSASPGRKVSTSKPRAIKGTARELENALRKMATGREQRMRDGYDNAVVRLPGDRKRARSQSSESGDRSQSPRKRHRTPVGEECDDDGGDDDDNDDDEDRPGAPPLVPSARQRSPERPKSSARSPAASQPGSPNKTVSSRKRSTINDEADGQDVRSPSRQRSPARSASPSKPRSPTKPASPHKANPSSKTSFMDGSRAPSAQLSVNRSKTAFNPSAGAMSGTRQPTRKRSSDTEEQPWERRGSIVTKMNPKMIPGLDGKPSDKPNPFFEPMPSEHTWHRRMANVFPFGETPYQERVLSDQINADLSRDHGLDKDSNAKLSSPSRRKSSLITDMYNSGVNTLGRVGGAFGGLFGYGSNRNTPQVSPEPSRTAPDLQAKLKSQVRSPFELPQVSEQEVKKGMKELGPWLDLKSPQSGRMGQKRKSSSSQGGRPKKRQDLFDDDIQLMSGGLPEGADDQDNDHWDADGDDEDVWPH